MTLLAIVFAFPKLAVFGNAPPDFANDVFSVLQKNCVACHNLQKAEGGLNLESLAYLKKGGDSGAAFKEKSSAESSLIKRVKGEEELMPPDGNNVGAKRLTAAEISMLAAWIDGGAIEGTKITSKVMQWQPLPESIRPIYAMDASADGQFTAIGRGNQAIVYQWINDGSSVGALLVDPTATVGESNLASKAPSTHLDLVQSVAISNDATRIATGGYRDVKIWRRQSGSFQDRVLANLRGSIVVQHSPNGQWIAKGTAAPSLELISSETGKIVARKDLDQDISSMAWSKNADRIALSLSDGDLQWMSAPTSGSAEIVVSHSQKLSSSYVELLVNDNQSVIGRTKEQQIHLWKWTPVEGQSPQWSRLQHFSDQSNVVSMAFSGPDTLLLGTEAGIVHVGSMNDGKILRKLEHGASLTKVVSSLDGKLVITVGKDGITKGWNISDGKLAWENRIDSDKALQIKKSEIAAARQKAKVERGIGKVPVLEKAKTAETENVAKLQKTRGELVESLNKKTAEAETQGKIVAESEAAVTAANKALEEAKKKLEQTQKDLETKKQQLATAEKAKADESAKIATLDTTIASAEQAVQKEATILATFKSLIVSEKTAKVVLEKNSNEIKTTANPIPATNAVLSLDGRSLHTTHTDGSIHTLRTTNGLNENLIKGGLERSTGLVTTNNGRVISTSDDGRAFGSEFSNRWTLERTIGDANESPFSDRVTALEFSEDGQSLLVASGPPSRFGELKSVSIANGTVLRDWGQIHSDTILVVKISPDGSTVATGGADKLVRLHSMTSNDPTRTLEGHTHHVLGLAWHDDGVILASSSADNTIKVWDVEAGQSQRTITGFGKEVTALEFIGRSNQLLSSCADQQIRLHDATNGKLIRSMGGPSDAVYSLAAISTNPFSDPNALAVAGGQDGVVWIWKVEDGKTVNQIK
ncbi:MAG: c-type cytochrome domain-containing protein [Pirellula sp.]